MAMYVYSFNGFTKELNHPIEHNLPSVKLRGGSAGSDEVSDSHRIAHECGEYLACVADVTMIDGLLCFHPEGGCNSVDFVRSIKRTFSEGDSAYMVWGLTDTPLLLTMTNGRLTTKTIHFFVDMLNNIEGNRPVGHSFYGEHNPAPKFLMATGWYGNIPSKYIQSKLDKKDDE